MTENQRLKILIDLLRFKTQKDFASAMKIKQGTLSDILRERNGMGISSTIKDKLELRFNVNIEWLEKGIGEPILNKLPMITESREGVPYFDISLDEVDHLQLNEKEPEYFVNYKPFNDCTAYLPVYGDSMYPKYASGEIIAVKEVTNLEILLWGEAYVVITNEKTNNLRTIKLLLEHPDSSKVILKSYNPNFKGETVIPKDSITMLYIIKGKITRNQL